MIVYPHRNKSTLSTRFSLYSDRCILLFCYYAIPISLLKPVIEILCQLACYFAILLYILHHYLYTEIILLLAVAADIDAILQIAHAQSFPRQ